MACWVYVLRGGNGRLYTGITARLRRRIREHDLGQTRGDAGKGPFELVYREKHADHGEARVRERFLKSGVGREWLRAKLVEDSGRSEEG